MTAVDLSPAALARAQREAAIRGVELSTCVAGFTQLDSAVGDAFDVVMACDNALAHLPTDDALVAALRSMQGRLAPGGLLMVSLRDYDALIAERPKMASERLFDGPCGRRITFQVWDWRSDGEGYELHQFIVRPEPARTGGWTTVHFATGCRALRRATLTSALAQVGLHDVRWHSPDETRFYQPIVTAHRQPK